MTKELLHFLRADKLGSVLLLGAALSIGTTAQAQQHFDSPGVAVQALVDAAKKDGIDGVVAVLGPDGRNIAASGDAVADAKARERFLGAYNAKNRIEEKGDSQAILVIGEEEWPFPIPLVRKDGRWHFDAAAGRQEILARRIGRNERNAIEVCLAYVEAQKEYAAMDPQSLGTPVYADRIVSRPGKRDGLFWPAPKGEPASPLGDLVAEATREGYKAGSGTPYHGYFYKILRAQGRDAAGGASDYVVKGRMIGGFALVAYPAEYRSSGVMTFICNHGGGVFQKDLGGRTPRIAGGMTTFNPDQSWRKASP